MVAVRDAWIGEASAMGRVRGFLEAVEDLLSPAIDPILAASLIERRRGAKFGRDVEAIQEVENRLGRLRNRRPDMVPEEGPLFARARRVLSTRFEGQ